MVNHRTFLAAVGIATVVAAPALSKGDATMPLATVAHRMGLTYAYLASDDAVSLIGHGMSITVRPGSPFFYINDRLEPVNGMTPTFESGDVVVSRAFAMQLATLERRYGDRSPSHRTIAQLPMKAPAAPPMERHVNDLMMTGTKSNDGDVIVSGNATPNSLVSIVLKAIESPELPTVFLNRSFTIANAQGKFKLEISTAPAYFYSTRLIAEAVGVDDQQPVSATYLPSPIDSKWKAIPDKD